MGQIISNILHVVQIVENTCKVINHVRKWYKECDGIIGTVGGTVEEEDEG